MNKEEKTAQMVYVVIPVYNEGSVIDSVIEEVYDAGYKNVLIVDDGSTDNTDLSVMKTEALLIKHKINRGKGAATKTGVEAAKKLGADIIVTMDGDGQHDPKDIPKLAQPIIEKKSDVVLGSRLMDPTGMPWYKIIHNKIANILVWYLFGLWVTDSQSGFRAYSRFASKIINTRYDKYEYDSEVLREIYLHKLKYTEVSIKVRYTEYSMGKIHKQGFINGIKTLYKMLWKLIN